MSWSAPSNTGPSITDYDMRWSLKDQDSWTEITDTDISATTATISGLSTNTEYDVQVRATNDEGTGEWSDSGTGSTDPNSAPRLTDGEPIEEELLSATLTAARFLNVRSGYSRAHSAGSLTDRTFELGGTTYSINSFYYSTATLRLVLDLDRSIPNSLKTGLELHLPDQTLTGQAAFRLGDQSLQWLIYGLGLKATPSLSESPTSRRSTGRIRPAQ